MFMTSLAMVTTSSKKIIESNLLMQVNLMVKSKKKLQFRFSDFLVLNCWSV